MHRYTYNVDFKRIDTIEIGEKTMDRSKIDNIIVYLIAIRNYAKDIHYNCAGANFYGNHLFADRFTEQLDEYIDLLKEVCLLGHAIKTLPSYDYLRMAADLIPQAPNDFKEMRDLMLNCLQEIENLIGISKGDENLVGAIAQDIQNNVGLINIMFGDTRDV